MDEATACYRKAVELLGRRAHFHGELHRKLIERGFDERQVEACLDRLHGDGYLDDRETARAYVDQRQRRGPEGAARVRAELQRRGVATEVIDAVLSELLPADDYGLAHEAAARWRRTHAEDRAALARHLARKGFTAASIAKVIDENQAGSNPS